MNTALCQEPASYPLLIKGKTTQNWHDRHDIFRWILLWGDLFFSKTRQSIFLSIYTPLDLIPITYHHTSNNCCESKYHWFSKTLFQKDLQNEHIRRRKNQWQWCQKSPIVKKIPSLYWLTRRISGLYSKPVMPWFSGMLILHKFTTNILSRWSSVTRLLASHSDGWIGS